MKNRNLILLLLLLGLRGIAALALGGTLLIHLLEETEGRLLGLGNLLPDSVGADLLIAGLALDGHLAKLVDELSDLLLLSGIKLILEVVHGCSGLVSIMIVGT